MQRCKVRLPAPGQNDPLLHHHRATLRESWSGRSDDQMRLWASVIRSLRVMSAISILNFRAPHSFILGVHVQLSLSSPTDWWIVMKLSPKVLLPLTSRLHTGHPSSARYVDPISNRVSGKATTEALRTLLTHSRFVA